ncbi:hypothetical protein PT317_01830 [Metamycoplasma hyosynoviae]|uniref:MnuA family membrane nuclease n=1 Tax=Metamycoplasma hyosynoviae TaxID=29559 RepID=UPI0023625249|nr:lipoprotein 17-related variable surface protein [Metamycoplasma hyosynoviae]MDD1360731.1 hypothetical protein [Metamycoplasma hyosynoviae]MDD1362155.1 hypothetical protein [Metamycoplasma hyosynoviae]
MRKKALLLSLALATSMPMFLVATNCKKNSWANFSGVTAVLKNTDKPIDDVQNSDIEFKYNNSSQKSQYEVIFVKITNRNSSRRAITATYYIKNKTTNEISEQKSISFVMPKKASEIEQDAEKIKFDFASSSEGKLPSEIETNDLDISNFDDTKYEVVVDDLIGDDNESNIKILYYLKSKSNGEESNVREIKLDFSLKKDIDQQARKITFALKDGLIPSETLPSSIQDDQIMISGYDESKYIVEIKSKTSDDAKGELELQYILKSNDGQETSKTHSSKIKYLKNSSGTIISIDDIAQNVKFKLKSKNASDYLASEIKRSDVQAYDYDSNNYKVEIKEFLANNEEQKITIKFNLRDLSSSDVSENNERTLIGFKKETSPLPPTPPEPPIGGETTEKTLRLSHWNVCNFGKNALPNSKKKPKAKAHAIASIIHNQKFDVVGLTEVDSVEVAPKIAELLNELETKKGTNNKWNYVIGDYKKSNGVSIAQASKGGDRSADFLYKENKVRPVKVDNKLGHFYDNGNFEKHFGGDYNEYARTPFCVKWELLNKSLTNKDFVFAISHFDGPGVKGGEVSSGLGGQIGSREANEAWNIPNVFSWMKDKFKDSDLVFQGDTNIPSGYADKAFASLKSDEKMLLNDNPKNATSLKKSIDTYSEPYDKMILKSSLKYSNPGFYKLWNFIKDDIFGWQSGITSYRAWKEYCDIHYPGSVPATNGAVYGYISDHCPTFFDLHFE